MWNICPFDDAPTPFTPDGAFGCIHTRLRSPPLSEPLTFVERLANGIRDGLVTQCCSWNIDDCVAQYLMTFILQPTQFRAVHLPHLNSSIGADIPEALARKNHS